MGEHYKERVEIIAEDFTGNLREYSFTKKEWQVLCIMWLNQNLSTREIWGESKFKIGEATIGRAIYKFSKIGWVRETTPQIKMKNLYSGGAFRSGKTNRKKTYDLTLKGERAYEEYSKKLKQRETRLL